MLRGGLLIGAWLVGARGGLDAVERLSESLLVVVDYCRSAKKLGRLNMFSI